MQAVLKPPRVRKQIEKVLGRPLVDADLVHVDNMDCLRSTQLVIVRQLATRKIPLAVGYLCAIAHGGPRAATKLLNHLQRIS
jgi:hypothetical protein